MLVPILLLAGLLGLMAGLAAYLFMQQKQQPDDEGAAPEAAPAAAPRRARGGGDRLRRQQQEQLRRRHARQDADEEEDEEEDEEPLNHRERRRRDRQQAREEEEERRRAKADKINAYDERRRRKEEEREAQERAQEEELRRAAEERQRREDAEAAKWMNMISVEEEGTQADGEENDEATMLGRFVDYIVSRKMVPIEEAAVEFGMRSSDVVERLQGLEAVGRISGVMDERGKFIYISRDEMEAVAAHIRSKGRVSIAALAAASNNLIDLEAKSCVAAAGAGAGAGPVIDFDSIVGEVAA